MQAQSKALTLSDVVLVRAGLSRALLTHLALIVGFSVVTALLAKIAYYPNPAVPITGQTLGVLLTGAVLGSKRGALSMLFYVSAGAAGLPFFAKAGRIPFSSWGYLLGFMVAAFVVGFLAERGWDRRFRTTAAAMLIGSVVIYLFGLPWLTFFVPLGKVLPWGLYPFIPGDLFKLVLAAAIMPSAWALVNRRRRRGES